MKTRPSRHLRSSKLVDAKRIVDAIRDLQGFREAQRLVKQRGLGSVVGFDELERLTANNGEATRAALAELYAEFAMNGRKFVYLYNVSDGVRAALLDAEPEIDRLGLANEWPWPPLDSDRIDLPQLVRAEQIGTTRFLIFGSHRIATTEEPFESDWMNDSVPDFVRESDITYRATRTIWAYDVIAIPESGPVELRISASSTPYRPHHADVRTSLLDSVARMISRRAAAEFMTGVVDVGECVTELYKNADDGRIYWLDFSCVTRAKRRERFSRRQPDDLRREAYHLAGTDAVSQAIEIFGLGVAWDVNDGTTVTLEFRGSPSRIQDGQLTLQAAVVSSLSTADEFAVAMDKLRRYVDVS